MREVILATNWTTEGQATALYLTQHLETFEVAVTRIAYGIPVGGDLEYIDEVTLAKALEGKTESLIRDSRNPVFCLGVDETRWKAREYFDNQDLSTRNIKRMEKRWLIAFLISLQCGVFSVACAEPDLDNHIGLRDSTRAGISTAREANAVFDAQRAFRYVGEAVRIWTASTRFGFTSRNAEFSIYRTSEICK